MHAHLSKRWALKWMQFCFVKATVMTTVCLHKGVFHTACAPPPA